MTDRITRQHRSWNMSRIRGSDTKPEITVRSCLHQFGYRFRLHRKDLPGKPDIVLPKYKLVIFVNGCFWHRHSGCRYAYTPKSRQDFWKKKFTDTIARDKRHYQKLRTEGWRIIIVWECALSQADFPDILDKAIRSPQDEIDQIPWVKDE